MKPAETALIGGESPAYRTGASAPCSLLDAVVGRAGIGVRDERVGVRRRCAVWES